MQTLLYACLNSNTCSKPCCAVLGKATTTCKLLMQNVSNVHQINPCQQHSTTSVIISPCCCCFYLNTHVPCKHTDIPPPHTHTHNTHTCPAAAQPQTTRSCSYSAAMYTVACPKQSGSKCSSQPLATSHRLVEDSKAPPHPATCPKHHEPAATAAAQPPIARCCSCGAAARTAASSAAPT